MGKDVYESAEFASFSLMIYLFYVEFDACRFQSVQACSTLSRIEKEVSLLYPPWQAIATETSIKTVSCGFSFLVSVSLMCENALLCFKKSRTVSL